MYRHRLMGHRTTLAVVLAIAAATLVACGGGDATPDPVGSAAPSTTAATDGSVADDRPVAPDFTLSLEPEGEFVLSETDNPVYLVFWAEW